MKMLVNLRGVPDDEQEEIRALLAEQDIDFYETDAGRWGIGQPGLWLRNPDQGEAARHLLAGYWEERSRRARDDREALKRAGKLPGIRDAFWRAPLRFLVAVGVIGAVLYISVRPFLDFAAGW